MTKTAAIYTRISLDRTGQGLGVQRQEDETRALAARLGLQVSEVFSDNDISAVSGKRRPGFEALLEAAPPVVLVWHLDRLARVSKDIEKVLDAGLTVHAVQAGALDLSTPSGRAVARTVTAWATYEGEVKSERQRSALRQRAARGDAWWSRVPFGYNSDTSINDEEAALVRKAYEDTLNGKSAHKIAQEWTQAGARLPGTKAVWQGRRVTELLKSPRNIARATYRGQDVGPAHWAPLVDEGTFYAVRQVLDDPKRRVGGAPKYSLLSGVLFCDRCKSPMNRWKGTLPSGNLFDRMRCNGCQFIVDRNWAEDHVTDQILRWQQLRGEEASSSTEDFSPEIERQEGRLVALGKSFASGTIELATLEAATAAIKDQIESLRKQQAEAATKTHLLSDEEIRQQWDGMSTDERRQVIADRWTLWADYEPGSPKGRLSRKRIRWCRVGQEERLERIAPRRYPQDAPSRASGASLSA